MDKKHKIFISSASKDLEQYRQHLLKAIDKLDVFEWDGMERFCAASSTPLEHCRERLATCDIYVGVIAHFPGSCPPGDDISFTEHEYNYAVELDKPILMFVAPDSFSTPATFRVSDSEQIKWDNFRNKILEKYIVSKFSNPENLAIEVITALTNWKTQTHYPTIAVNIKPGNYHLIVKGKNTISINDIELKSEAAWFLHPNEGDWYIQWVMFIPEGSPKPIIYDFTKGTIPKGIEFRRTSYASYRPILSEQEITAVCDMPRFEEIKNDISALVLEPGRSNLVLNSSKPETQYVNLNKGTYTLWCVGVGHVSIEKPNHGTAKHGVPLVFDIKESGPVLVKVFGNINRFQLENGKGATSYIETGKAAVSRASDRFKWRNPTEKNILVNHDYIN